MTESPEAALRDLVHDLRGSLAIVEGFAGLLERGDLPEEQRAVYAARIRAATMEMAARLDAATV